MNSVLSSLVASVVLVAACGLAADALASMAESSAPAPARVVQRAPAGTPAHAAAPSGDALLTAACCASGGTLEE